MEGEEAVYFGFGHCIVFNALAVSLQNEEKRKQETIDVRVAGSSTAGIECNVRLSNVRGWLRLELISTLSVQYQLRLDIQVGDDDAIRPYPACSLVDYFIAGTLRSGIYRKAL